MQVKLNQKTKELIRLVMLTNCLMFLCILYLSIVAGTSLATEEKLTEFVVEPSFSKGESYRYKLTIQNFPNCGISSLSKELQPSYISFSEISMKIEDVKDDGSIDIAFTKETGCSIVEGDSRIAQDIGKSASIRIFPGGQFEMMDYELSVWVYLLPLILYNQRLRIGEEVEISKPLLGKEMFGSAKYKIIAKGVEKVSDYDCLKVEINSEASAETNWDFLDSWRRKEIKHMFLAYERGFIVIKSSATILNEKNFKKTKKSISSQKIDVKLMQ